MKNVHVLPTDKPSRLAILHNGKFHIGTSWKKDFNVNPQNIYITNDEEIKEGDWFMSDFNSFPLHNIKELSEREGTLGWKQKDLKNNLKIILTTDADLIKDGVQAIPDDFLEWFVKNPSCEVVEVEIESKFDRVDGHYHDVWEIIIPKEELERGITITHVEKQEALEDIKLEEVLVVGIVNSQLLKIN